jgi:hypothetical protein
MPEGLSEAVNRAFDAHMDAIRRRRLERLAMAPGTTVNRPEAPARQADEEVSAEDAKACAATISLETSDVERMLADAYASGRKDEAKEAAKGYDEGLAAGRADGAELLEAAEIRPAKAWKMGYEAGGAGNNALRTSDSDVAGDFYRKGFLEGMAKAKAPEDQLKEAHARGFDEGYEKGAEAQEEIEAAYEESDESDEDESFGEDDADNRRDVGLWYLNGIIDGLEIAGHCVQKGASSAAGRRMGADIMKALDAETEHAVRMGGARAADRNGGAPTGDVADEVRRKAYAEGENAASVRYARSVADAWGEGRVQGRREGLAEAEAAMDGAIKACPMPVPTAIVRAVNALNVEAALSPPAPDDAVCAAQTREPAAEPEEDAATGDDMQVTVQALVTFEGVHRWPEAPDYASFLRNPHRHVFYVRAYKDARHDDRDVEFLVLAGRVEDAIREMFPPLGREHPRVDGPTPGASFLGYHLLDLGTMSCEMIARLLIDALDLDGCGVWEDDENGALLWRK